MFDLKRHRAEWSVYDIKVPREWFESRGSDSSALTVLWCHTLIICSAPLQVEHTFWSEMQPPYNHMCHQSTARARRDQPPRSGAAVAQNRLRNPWWRHTILSLVRFCDDKHNVCCVFILSVSHSSWKVKLQALWSPLVAGCSTGHEPHPLHVSEWDFSQKKKNKNCFSKFGFGNLR